LCVRLGKYFKSGGWGTLKCSTRWTYFLVTVILTRVYEVAKDKPGNSDGKGRLSTINLIVLTGLVWAWENYFKVYKTNYLNVEVNCTEPFP
jgi:hypothetical protein